MGKSDDADMTSCYTHLILLFGWPLRMNASIHRAVGPSVIIGLMCVSCVPTPSAKALAGPELQPQVALVDLGIIGNLASVRSSFIVKNVGDKPAVITSVHGSCRCTAAKPDRDEIQPGDSIEIALTFNPRSKLGKLYETVEVIWDGAGFQSLVMPIIAEVKEYLTVNANSLSFEVPGAKGANKAYLEVASADDEDFDIVGVTVPNFLLYESAVRLDRGRHRLAFGLVSEEETSPAMHKGTIDIETTHPNQTHVQLLSVLNVRYSLVAEPSAGLLRVSEQGEPDIFEVAVSRVDGIPFRIGRIDTAGAPLRALYETKSDVRHAIRFVPNDLKRAGGLRAIAHSFPIQILGERRNSERVTVNLVILDESDEVEAG